MSSAAGGSTGGTADGDAARSEPSFEESLAAVERAIRALEAGDIPLEDSIDLYATAMQSLKRCHRVLDRAEGRLEVLGLVGELARAMAELLQLLEETAELELLRKRGIDRRARFLSTVEW